MRRALNVLGRILVALGLLVLSFVAFQLWGTGLIESHSQSALRTQLDRELPPGALHRALPPSPPGTPPQVAPPRAAPAEGQPVGYIDVPAIGVDQVVVQGIGTADLRMGPGHYPGTPLPGEAGNVAIAGHRTTYAHPFYNLNALVPGDRVILTTPQGIFVYRVRWVTSVSPDDTAVLAPSRQALLTLTTCDPRYSASHRLVLRAALARSLLFGEAGAAGHPAPTTTSPSRAGTAGSGQLAGGTAAGSWAGALGWGLLVLALCVAVWAVARRCRRRWTTVAVYAGGAVVVLAALFVFFYSLSPLLPASI